MARKREAKKTFTLFIAASDKRAFRKAATRDNRPLSSWMIHTCRKALAREKR